MVGGIQMVVNWIILCKDWLSSIVTDLAILVFYKILDLLTNIQDGQFEDFFEKFYY